MKMETARQMFTHELGDLRDAETRLAAAMGKIEKKLHDENLKQLFEEHCTETENHIERLDQIYEELGAKPRKQPCRSMMGIIEEFQDFIKEQKPDPALLDIYVVAAAIKAEHYELSAYETLLAMARKLELNEAAKDLEENLNDERNSLQKLQELGQELLDNLPDEESEEEEEGEADEEESEEESEDEESDESEEKPSTPAKRTRTK